MSTKMVKLAILEDDPKIRSAYLRFFEVLNGIECVAGFGSVEEMADNLVELDQLDVLLSDIGLPGKSGIEGIEIARAQFPECQVLILTVHDDADHIFKAICAGASGYLLKNTSLPRIGEAVFQTMVGGASMSPTIARKVMNYFNPQKENENQKLTPRENQIVQAIVDGLSYKMVADRLNISFETVKHHIKNIYRKLHINSKAELITKSYQGGI